MDPPTQRYSPLPSSSCEAELVALSSTVCEAIWLKKTFWSHWIIHRKNLPRFTWITNQQSKNPIQHRKSKHTHISSYFLRNHVNKQRTIKLMNCHTLDGWSKWLTSLLSHCRPLGRILQDATTNAGHEGSLTCGACAACWNIKSNKCGIIEFVVFKMIITCFIFYCLLIYYRLCMYLPAMLQTLIFHCILCARASAQETVFMTIACLIIES